MRNSKLYKEKSQGVLSIIAGLLLLVGASALSAGVSYSSDETAADSNTDSSATTSTVDSQEKCTWYLTGIQASISLEVLSGGTGDKYDGTEMVLEKAADSDLTVYTSGNQATGTADANSECTFYNGKTGVSVSNSIGSYAVTAVDSLGADAQMNYSLSVSNPLKVTYMETTCWNNGTADAPVNAWTNNASAIEMYSALNATGSVMTLAPEDTLQVNDADVSERCSMSSIYQLKIPAGKEPTRPGDNITFTGPSVVFDVTLPDGL
jgi:hypothetical protein